MARIGPSRYHARRPHYKKGHLVHTRKKKPSGGAIGAAGVEAAAAKAGIVLRGRFGL